MSTLCSKISKLNEEIQQLESVSQPQIARMFALMKANKIVGNLSAVFLDLVKSSFNVAKPDDLTPAQYKIVCDKMIQEFSKDLGSTITNNSEPVRTDKILVTSPQVSRLYALLKANGVAGANIDEFLSTLKLKFKITKFEELTRVQYVQVCDVLLPEFAEKMKNIEPPKTATTPLKPVTKVTPQQVKRMYAIMGSFNIRNSMFSNSYEADEFVYFILNKYAVKSLDELNRDQYDEICNTVMKQYAIDKNFYNPKDAAIEPVDKISTAQSIELSKLLKASNIQDSFYADFVILVKQKYRIKALEFLTQSQLKEVIDVLIPQFVKDNKLEDGKRLLLISSDDVESLQNFVRTLNIVNGSFSHPYKSRFYAAAFKKFDISNLSELKKSQVSEFQKFAQDYAQQLALI